MSTLCFGVMTFGPGKGMFSAVGNTQKDDARRQVDLCLEAGVNLFDTADAYSNGQSEEILAAALGERRSSVLIATKAFARTGKGVHDIGLSRRHLVAACEASLKRLNTDWIDLYQVHNFDSLTPVDETLRSLDDLVRAGKVRYIGCSNHHAWQLMKALNCSERCGLQRYVAQQIQYSLAVREAETELLPAGVDQGVGALVWSPLAMGYLSGKFRGGSAQQTRLQAWSKLESIDTARTRAVVEALFEIAGVRGASPSQVALNWVCSRAGVTSVIVGARTEEQLRDNLAAASWSLKPEEISKLDQVSATPVPYPRSTHDMFHPERNPRLFS